MYSGEKNTDWAFKANWCLNALDTHCPYEYKLIQIQRNNEPWLSKHLIIILHSLQEKDFFYIQTVKTEKTYKKYKNMLTCRLSSERLKNIL